MAKLDKEQLENYTALSKAQRYLSQKLERAKKALAEKPLNGWSQEKHEAYHQREIAQYETAINVLFVEQMRINPD